MKLSELTTKKDEVAVYECALGYAKMTYVIAGMTNLKTSRVLTILKKLKKNGFVENINSPYKRQLKWRAT